MHDPLMENILKGFDKAGQDRMAQDAATKPANGHAVTMDSDPMLAILSNFSSVTEDNKVGGGPGAKQEPYLPGKHKMAKNTDKKHPAKGYLVGGEDGEPEPGEEVVAEVDVEEDVVGAKQSFSDIVRSIEEVDAEKESKLKQELHDELNGGKRTLEKNDKGTYDLAEGGDFRIKRELYAEIKALTQFVRECQDESALQEAYEMVLEAQYTLGNASQYTDDEM